LLKADGLEQDLFTLWALMIEGAIGRYRLARLLGVSEGVARGAFVRMKREGWITVKPRVGARLSEKGQRTLSLLMKRNGLIRVERVHQEILGLGPESVILQVAGGSKRMGRGVEQRDAAIKEGAKGAVTFVFDGRMLNFPGVAEPVSRRSPTTFQELKKRLKMKKGDAVLIVFADTWWAAARGGFSAVRTLN
jgi:hypothetical protein